MGTRRQKRRRVMPPTRPSVDDEPDGPVENITVEKMG
jgi:hypothetical protein